MKGIKKQKQLTFKQFRKQFEKIDKENELKRIHFKMLQKQKQNYLLGKGIDRIADELTVCN
jgi:hypothetical protein|tara:strand:- start:529 stop:711 length:183 start_codon:yes stop_codon:yes gene_type:complete